VPKIAGPTLSETMSWLSANVEALASQTDADLTSKVSVSGNNCDLRILHDTGWRHGAFTTINHDEQNVPLDVIDLSSLRI